MRVIKWLDDHFEESIMVVLLMALSIVIMLQVIMRYVFSASLPWPDEFARYCYIASAIVSISYCVKKGYMLRIDLLVQFMPKKLQDFMNIFVQVVVFAFFGYLFIYSFDVVNVAYISGQKSPSLGLPFYLFYVLELVEFALVLVRCIQSIIGILKAQKKEKTATAITEGR